MGDRRQRVADLQDDLPDAGVGPDREAHAQRQRQRRAVARPAVQHLRAAVRADRLTGATPDRRAAPRPPTSCARAVACWNARGC